MDGRNRKRKKLNFIILFIYFLCVIITADIISAVEFDSSGDYLAIGDRGGRVVILERNNAKVQQQQKLI